MSTEKSFGSNSGLSNGGHVGVIPILDSGSECEDAHMRTAEAFMSGIKSAISASLQVQKKQNSFFCIFTAPKKDVSKCISRNLKTYFVSHQSQDANTSADAIAMANGVASNLAGPQHDGGAGLSAELVGEVNSVLAKLMSSLNTCDPSLIPLITNLQCSLKATVNTTTQPSMAMAVAPTAVAVKKDEALSEFSHNENPFFDNLDDKVYTTSKIPWKIRY